MTHEVVQSTLNSTHAGHCDDPHLLLLSAMYNSKGLRGELPNSKAVGMTWRSDFAPEEVVQSTLNSTNAGHCDDLHLLLLSAVYNPKGLREVLPNSKAIGMTWRSDFAPEEVVQSTLNSTDAGHCDDPHLLLPSAVYNPTGLREVLPNSKAVGTTWRSDFAPENAVTA